MLCERAQELFSEYCDGTLQESLTIPFENHLNECSSCHSQMDGLIEVYRILDEAPMVEPPVEFREIVWRKIDAQQKASMAKKEPLFAFDWKSVFKPVNLGWAAAALVIVMLAPVAMPGNNTVAKMFPWNLVYSPANSGATSITIGSASILNVGGRSTVAIQVNNSGPSAVPIEVSMVPGVQKVVIEAEPGKNQAYEIGAAPEVSGAGVKVVASWQSGSKKEMVEVPVP